MRVLFVSNLYPPNVVGGYEELCHEVASRFAARGHEVAVLTSCYGGRTQPIPGQVVHQSLRLIVGRTIYDGFDGPPSQQTRHDQHLSCTLCGMVSQGPCYRAPRRTRRLLQIWLLVL